LIGWGKTALLMALFCLIMAAIVIAVLTSVCCTVLSECSLGYCKLRTLLLCAAVGIYSAASLKG